MRKGFLSNSSKSYKSSTIEELDPDNQNQICNRSSLAAGPRALSTTPQAADKSTAGIEAEKSPKESAAWLEQDSKKARAALADCLELLQGPSDERRLAGLVIATTRLVGKVGVKELRSIYEAAGFTFLNRLLLPLSKAQAIQPAIRQDESLSVNTGALALSLLASFMSIPSFCQEPQLTSRTPLFSKVILAGGVAAVLDPEASTTAEGQRVNLSSLEDALIIATGIGLADGHLAFTAGAIRAASRCMVHHAVQHQAVTSLAMQLMSASMTPRVPAAFSGANGEALVNAVPVLAVILAGPATLSAASSAVFKAGTSTDLLAMQLDALHLLLLILPVPLPQGAEVQAALERQAQARGPWLEAMRDGLHQLLRSKTGPRQRHGALQLAAAVAGLAGSSWLLGSSKDNPAGSFFQLLVRLLKVELHLLLRDALEPDARVPSLQQAEDVAESTMQTGAAEPANGHASENESVAGDSETEEIGIAAGLRNVQLGEQDEAGSQTQTHGKPSLRPGAGEAGQTAGERAAHLLPPLLELVEASIDALAQDCDAAEAIASGQPVDHATLQVLSDKEAAAMGDALHEAADMLLQFLEARTERLDGLEDEMSLAVTRCLGRFLADAPTSHGERVRQLLPQLLAMHQGRALSFLGPALSQLAQPQQPEGDASELQSWRKLLHSPEVLDVLLARVAHIAGQAHHAWQAASSAADSSARQTVTGQIAQEADGQLDCVCTLAADLLDSRATEASAASQGSVPQAAAERMQGALAALCQCSVSPRTPAASMGGQHQEIRAKLVLGLLVSQLVLALHRQGASLGQPAVESASNTILDALQTGDGFRLIHAAHLRMKADQPAGLASESYGSLGSLDSLSQQSTGDAGDIPSIDFYWTALLQSATLLAEGYPDFAKAAASSRFIKQLLGAVASDDESVDELELRLFCQTVQRPAQSVQAA